MKPRILIAEDDTSLCLLLQFRFQEAGYQVDTVSNGSEAIEKLATENYDIIVSDIMMPLRTGLEVVEHVRNAQKLQTKIILLSNAGQEEMVMRAFDHGANDFLSKPFIVNELLVRVQRNLAAA